VILVCVFNFIQNSIHANLGLFFVFDWQRSHIRQSTVLSWSCTDKFKFGTWWTTIAQT